MSETKTTTPQIINPAEFGVELEKATTLESSFLPKKIETEGYVSVYEAIINKELSAETAKEARQLRLKLVKVRTGIADIHSTEKAFSLAYGKLCDAVKNKLTLPVQQMEEKLSEIEKHQERVEAEAKSKLILERKAELEQYNVDTTFISLDTMNEDQFAAFKETSKVAFDKKVELERIAKEQAAELERIAKEEAARKEKEAAAERKRIEDENAKLKVERDAAAKKHAAELAKQKAEQKKKDDAAALELANQKAIADAKEAEAKKERDRLAAELKKKDDAEKAIADAKRKADLAPDIDKIRALYTSIKTFEFPSVTDPEAKKVIDVVKADFDVVMGKIVHAVNGLK